MSPSWRDRVRIALAPRQVALVRFARGLRPRISGKRLVECAPGPVEAPWEGALLALPEALTAEDCRGAEASVVLSNHFVRYALVPWSDEVQDSQEEMALTRYCFASAYGDAAETWAFRLSPGKPRAPRMASAVDRALVESLREAFKAAGLRLASIQPYLMAGVNHWRAIFGGAPGWFALVEPGRLCCARFDRDGWQAVRTARLGADTAGDLTEWLDRERRLAGGADHSPRVLLHAPEAPELALPRESGWSVEPLRLQPRPGFSPFDDRRYATALTGCP